MTTAEDHITAARAEFFIKPGYTPRAAPEYFHDTLADTRGITHQPDAYPLAAHLAAYFGCRHIIDIGCGLAHKLAELHPRFELIGVDFGDNLRGCRERYPFGRWIECDLERERLDEFDPAVVASSIVICSDVIEHLVDPSGLLANLRGLLEHAPAAVLTTPERDLVRGSSHFGPPQNPSHVREWNLAELETLLRAEHFNLDFIGLTMDNDHEWQKRTTLAVLARNDAHLNLSERAPAGFRVVALMTAYNEADIIAASLRHLFAQGVEVYLLDNWSSDATFEIAETFLGRGLIGLERFPAGGASRSYDWRELLWRVEELSRTIEADWFIHHDVDELRESPWPGVSLRDGFYRVERRGFNCVDHTVINFHPVDNDFADGADFESHFRYFEFGRTQPDRVQIKAWKNSGQSISLAASGGHEVQFDGRRVYPYKFLLKHYSIRSQQHGERKVFGERKPRWNAGEKSMGWHSHYDAVRAGHNFLRRPQSLELFDRESFYRTYLVERLSGIGCERSHR
ncbi:MAG TPA: glycosyltransferase family 2 protein [Pyrinomonadaceae bacterium]|jgi:2-polyprenyl-3-methyl-5-hydroxy-6-metoxy-1,4-benzoquinol methylase/glycosyltransferase involved in cell wall biosynthesis